MNTYKILTGFYGFLKIENQLLNHCISPLRYICRKVATSTIPTYFDLHPVDQDTIEKKKGVIISLTSFPQRMSNIHIVINSLLRQSVVPEKIILWLSRDQFPNDMKDIPVSLKKLIGSIFQIEFVNGDIRSHKKYLYAFQRYPEYSIITVDDDMIYHPEVIRSLIETSCHYPGCVIANRASRREYDGENLLPYIKWTTLSKPVKDNNIVQIGCDGVMYPPHSLFHDVANADLAFKLAPLADDLWLNAMVILNNNKVIKSPFKYWTLGIVTKAPTLTSSNVLAGKNDQQIAKIREYYINTLNIDPFKKR